MEERIQPRKGGAGIGPLLPKKKKKKKKETDAGSDQPGKVPALLRRRRGDNTGKGAFKNLNREGKRNSNQKTVDHCCSGKKRKKRRTG